jgi:hypothetical protein
MNTCSECDKEYPQEQLANFGEHRVCVLCKPAYVQKIKEGAGELIVKKKQFSVPGLLQAYIACVIPLSLFLLSQSHVFEFGVFIEVFFLIGGFVVPASLLGLTMSRVNWKTYTLALITFGLSLFSCCNHLAI